MRNNRLALAATLAALSCAAAGVTAQAQTTPAPAAPAPTPAPSAAAATTVPPQTAVTDPVVARVGNDAIHASDVQDAMGGVPEQYRQLPPQVLFPMLVDQLIDRHAILALAEKQGLQNDPQVKAAMDRAANTALENAMVSKSVRPQVTQAAIKAKYDAMYAQKPGEAEVHARHILVASEDKAKSLIDQLNKGADFAALAKANSTDPGAAQGGDLGWFKKGDMLPEFSAVAFALQPGQISQTPVHTRYGWHVIKVEGRRTAPPPAIDQASQEIRQTLIQDAVQQVIKEARADVTIVHYNMDGSVQQPPGATAPTTPPVGAAPQAKPAQ